MKELEDVLKQIEWKTKLSLAKEESVDKRKNGRLNQWHCPCLSLALTEAIDMPKRGLKRSYSQSDMFNIVNGHTAATKSTVEYNNSEVSHACRRCPDECFRAHRSQLSNDAAKLMLEVETVMKAKEGFEARRRSLGLSPSKPTYSNGVISKEQAKALKRKKKQEKAEFLDWKMPVLR